MFRRHPILTVVFGLLLSATIALAIFLGTFDLDRYRAELQQTLSAALNRPVSLGKARLSFSRGPAFDFSDISIGPTADRNDGLQAAHLLLKLEWDALLQGKVTFSEIDLKQPRLTVDLPPAATAAEPAPPAWPTRLDGLEKIQVRALTISNGSLLLTDRRHALPRSLAFAGLNARLRGLPLSRAIALEISGALPQDGQIAPFSATGTITPSNDLRHWQDSALELALDLEHFAPESLLAWQAPESRQIFTTGRVALHTEVKGALATGLDIRLDARGEELQLQLPKVWPTPRGINQLRLQGTLAQTGDTLILRDLDLAIDKLALSGQLTLGPRNNVPWISATLASSAVPLRDLMEILPLREAVPQWQRLRTGTLQLESAQLECPQADLPDSRKILESLQFRLSLHKSSFQLDQPNDIEKISATAAWDKGRLTLTDGQAQFENLPLRFSGTIDTPWEKDFPLSLAVAGSLPSHSLLTMATKASVEGLTLTGPLPLRLNISGTRQTLLANLESDLTDIGARYRDAANKPAGLPGLLELQAEITPAQIRLRLGKLQLGPLDLSVQGELSLLEQEPFSLNIAAEKLDLQACRPYLPLLEKLVARGMLDLRYRLTGTAGAVAHHEGVATLTRVGVHLTRVIADINDASGEILLYPDHAESRNLTLKLGSSPLDILARVTSFEEPSIDILLKGEAVRSDEVIFRNNQAYLRQLDGHLVINHQGIFFDPVKVRLDGGTEATVRGAVTNFSAPEVALDIEAGYGNIDEVIALWRRTEGAPPAANSGSNHETRVFIAARAHKGQLGNLRFQDARGDITLRRGVLAIFPLQFDAGSGSCLGHVAVDSSAGSPPLLKISGHLKNFDASAIYHELLQRKGLVSGTLEGDFYLEGIAGKRFLETSNGGLSFTVDKGVLRKFQFLSKVFSIFNVSQILTLQLPDMDTEGMPFSTLKASAALNQGTLSTSDLFIESSSMNLSLVGDLDLNQNTMDMVLGVKPLRTVDQVVTNIPIAGWLLAGDEKALITAHFEIKGNSSDPEVTPIPITSVSEKVLGIFKRVLGLPGKVVSDVGDLFQ
ncbi:DUF748 domain-containing protein [Trichloromonas sp.]|uniref:YhdP family protein n=1 Tax=Trichloromonas sp. TaxID=3069249 RepID=UPI003D816869